MYAAEITEEKCVRSYVAGFFNNLSARKRVFVTAIIVSTNSTLCLFVKCSGNKS